MSSARDTEGRGRLTVLHGGRRDGTTSHDATDWEAFCRGIGWQADEREPELPVDYEDGLARRIVARHEDDGDAREFHWANRSGTRRRRAALDPELRPAAPPTEHPADAVFEEPYPAPELRPSRLRRATVLVSAAVAVAALVCIVAAAVLSLSGRPTASTVPGRAPETALTESQRARATIAPPPFAPPEIPPEDSARIAPNPVPAPAPVDSAPESADPPGARLARRENGRQNARRTRDAVGAAARSTARPDAGATALVSELGASTTVATVAAPERVAITSGGFRTNTFGLAAEHASLLQPAVSLRPIDPEPAVTDAHLDMRVPPGGVGGVARSETRTAALDHSASWYVADSNERWYGVGLSAPRETAGDPRGVRVMAQLDLARALDRL